MTTRPSRLALTIALPAGLGLVLAGAGAAHADPTDYSLVVGVPAVTYQGEPNSGVVDNRVRSGGEQALSEHQLGLGDEGDSTDDRFGASVLVWDLNQDGYDDMVVGAPGLASDSDSGPGRVYVLFGTATGITNVGEITLTEPGGQGGDLFGGALTMSYETTESPYLFVGAPGRAVNGKAGAGAVLRYRIGSDGKPTYLDTTTQDDSLVPGSAKAGDHFGSVLATASDGAVVGVPDADVGSATDAGEIVHLRMDGDGTYQQGEVLTQNSAGVPGVAETGDHFGAALTRNAGAVGVPGEDVGSLKDAGSVQTFTLEQSGTSDVTTLAPSVSWTQDSTGVPGKAEAGDEFGAALSVGIYSCQEYDSYAVGSPGEDIGTTSNAGSVTLVTADPSYQCPSQSLSQGGGGIPGAAEAGDHVGAALGTIHGNYDLEEDRYDTLIVGDPGENIGKDTDTGRVYEVNARYASALQVRTDHFFGGDAKGLQFGSVLANPYQ